jgi:hypothetical protein
MVVYSRLIARGKVCGPLVGWGVDFVFEINSPKIERERERERLKESISKEIESEEGRKVYREDIRV